MRTVAMRLPAGLGNIWMPSTAFGLVGRMTELEFDGHRETVRITSAALCPDPAYVEIEMEILERHDDLLDAISFAAIGISFTKPREQTS